MMVMLFKYLRRGEIKHDGQEVPMNSKSEQCGTIQT